jgi:hypothetical protein
VGGGYGNRDGDMRASGPEHLPIEIWNPQTGSWRLGPAQAHKRAYHSTALLLPDGRVVSAGDDLDPTKDPNRQTDVAELYEPAYLFAPGPRPSITAAPSSVEFDQSFSIRTSSPITRATLVSPGATTHANDMHQRHVELRIRPTATGADLVAPPNGNIAPPGQYMLFGLSATGKPSVGRWITIGGASPAPGDPAPPPGGGAPVPPSDQGTPPVMDQQAPRISLVGVSRDLRRAARRGVRLRLRADEPATLSVALTIGRATARRLGVAHHARSPVTVGRRLTALRAGESRLHVAPRRSARRAMRRVRRIKLNIRLVATDAAGNTSRRVRTVTLKR